MKRKLLVKSQINPGGFSTMKKSLGIKISQTESSKCDLVNIMDF